MSNPKAIAEIEGVVIGGNRLGRTLGFPTANIDIAGRNDLENGVYASEVDIDGKIYFSANRDIMEGEFVRVRITGAMDGELTGEEAED